MIRMGFDDGFLQYLFCAEMALRSGRIAVRPRPAPAQRRQAGRFVAAYVRAARLVRQA